MRTVYEQFAKIQSNIHGDNIQINLQVLKYLFWLFVLTYGDPDLLGSLVSLVQSWI